MIAPPPAETEEANEDEEKNENGNEENENENENEGEEDEEDESDEEDFNPDAEEEEDEEEEGYRTVGAFAPGQNVDVDGKDREGHTPLHVALLYGSIQCLRALLEAEAKTYVTLEGSPP